MGVVDPLKGKSSALMTFSENFRFNPNYIDRYRTKIISYLPLAESSTWQFHVTKFVALSASKVKSILTLKSVVIFPACVFHCIGVSSCRPNFFTSLPIAIVELHPLSNRMRKFLNLALPFIVLYGWSGELTFSIIREYDWYVSQIRQSFKFVQIVLRYFGKV